MQQEELDFAVTVNTVIPIDKDQLATAAEIRNLTKRGSDNYIKVPYDNLQLRPGHNGRTEKNPGFSKESLEELARSIITIGLQDPLTVAILKNGTALIIKGERRWRAIGIIRDWIKNGNVKEFSDINAEKIPDFDLVECFSAPKVYNEQDYIIVMLAENMARVDLTPMEEAEGFMRAKQSGMSAAQIAKSVPGLSAMQVSNRLKLAALSSKEKELIEEGKISPTAAVKLSAQVSDPEERVEIIEEAASGEDGKLKISAVLDQIKDNEENENPANLVDGEEANNPLRNGDLIDPIKSGADDDLSMKGTSPKARPDAAQKGDPAEKSVAQPDADEFDDEMLKSGTKTAFDLTLKVMADLKEISWLLGRDKDPKYEALITNMERNLYSIKSILKIKKKK